MYPISSDTVPSRSMKTALFMDYLCQHVSRGLTHILNADAVHASMIDRAFAKKARTAFNRILHDTSAGAEGRCDSLISRAEYGYRWSSESCCDVHRPGVIRNYQG